MKQYRIRTEGKHPQWSGWLNLDTPLKDNNILTIQFNAPLTVEEAREFFKHYVEGLLC